MPTYAIIVPTYNSAGTLAPLLESLSRQTCTDFEAIVVDDASTDETPHMVQRYPVRYERLSENRGPAHARNVGVQHTAAPWLVFTDADTEWLPDTLAQLDAVLRARPDLDALVGSYAGRPANAGFVPRYKALWEFCVMDLRYPQRPDEAFPMNSWAPRPGAIRRSAFTEVGGFDVRFTGADLEDMELGYRLHAAGHAIGFAPHVRIRHHYPPTARRELSAFARRVVWWIRMARGRGVKLDSHGEGSASTAAAHLTGFAAFWLAPASVLWWPLGAAALLAMAGFVWLNRTFLAAAWREEGRWFAARALAYCWVHTITLGFAAGYGLLTAGKEVQPDGG